MSRVATYTGSINILSPAVHDIRIEDIAHSLAQSPRFNGHGKFPFSVAQHSMNVARMLDNNLKLAGLLHDAAEAYIGDSTSPLKRDISQLVAVEHNLKRAIFRRFDIDHLWDASAISNVDKRMLKTEALVLFQDCSWWDMPYVPFENVEVFESDWRTVKNQFLGAFDTYRRLASASH